MLLKPWFVDIGLLASAIYPMGAREVIKTVSLGSNFEPERKPASVMLFSPLLI